MSQTFLLEKFWRYEQNFVEPLVLTFLYLVSGNNKTNQTHERERGFVCLLGLSDAPRRCLGGGGQRVWGVHVFERERGAACALIYFYYFIIDPQDEEATGDDLEHVPIDDLQYDIDVSEEMDSEADQ